MNVEDVIIGIDLDYNNSFKPFFSSESMGWQDMERPGFFGRNRDSKFKEYDGRFGEGNWRIAWIWRDKRLEFVKACKHYEQSYFIDSFKRKDVWNELVNTASSVYDMEPRDIESGFDYTIQKGNATHIQDIAIRNVVRRTLREFKGSELVQIKGQKTKWGALLSPGKVPFYKPEMIILPEMKGWWDVNSIEDFWQRNKVLQAKEPELKLF